MKGKAVLSIVIIFIFLLFLFLCNEISAGLRVDPVTIEVVVSKGAEKEGIIKVGNTDSKPINVRVSPEKFGGGDRDVNSWISFEPKEVLIKGFDEAQIKYKIKMPEDVVGEIRCMVFLVANEAGENPSSVGIRFGIPVYAVSGGTEVVDAEVSDIFVNYNTEKSFLSGSILVKNKGNAHIRPFVNINILGGQGSVVSTFSIPFGEPAQVGQDRPFMYQQNVKLEPGKYKLSMSVDYGKLYGLSDKVAQGEKEFVVEVPTEKTEVETTKVETGAAE